MLTEEQVKKVKKIPEVMGDDDLMAPEQIAREIDVGVPLVRQILYWLANERDNYEKVYRPRGGDKHGGGEVEVLFRREQPKQRSLADFA